MKYTHLWNGAFVSNIQHLSLNNKALCLEIGCFEGLTTNYIVDNMLSMSGKLVCVDPLEDTYLVDDLTTTDILNNKNEWGYFQQQYERFIDNTKHNSEKIDLYRERSSTALPRLLHKYKEAFDFIYVDGDHREHGVYLDGTLSFDLCKQGGIILFDDYLWADCHGEQVTKKGIDRFLTEYEDRIQIVINNYQLAIIKK